MIVLTGGCNVIEGAQCSQTDGTRRFRVPISRSMGARDIAQTISIYSAGLAPARRNATGEEVLYVVRGSGGCHVGGKRFALAPGTAVYIPPGSVYQIENTGAASGDGEIEVVAVCCPEDDATQSEPATAAKSGVATSPPCAVREQDQPPIPTGDRTFKLLINQATGCKRVTQFIGVIPPGRAGAHRHTYEEAMYILEGEGRVWTDDGGADFKEGTSIYLPRGVAHSLENTGATNVRLLGVFHPAGSPASRYDD